MKVARYLVFVLTDEEDDMRMPLMHDGEHGPSAPSSTIAQRTPPLTPRRGRSRTPPPRVRSRTPPPRRSGRTRAPTRRPSRLSDQSGAPGCEEPIHTKGSWGKYAWGVAVVAYLVAAVVHSPSGAVPLLAMAGFVLAVASLQHAWARWGKDLLSGGLPEEPAEGDPDELRETRRLLQLVMGVGMLIAAITTFVMLDVLPHNQWSRLMSLGGVGVFILICLMFSDSPKDVVWRPVFWGMLSQFTIAALTLKWSAGFKALNKMGDVIMSFLSFAEEGAEFIYGPNYQDHYFAFVVLSIIIFFGSFLGVCYHLGIIQYIIDNMSYLMTISFQVSGVDAVGAVGNMFVGPCESALLVKPFLYDLTRSELQSLMISGMGSVSGGSLAAYITYGIPIDHVLVAIMLSAPASIMVAKILCPEREVSKVATVQCPPGECTNVIEAAAQGAADCIPLVLNIGGIMLAFISLLALLDAVLGYFGTFVGLDDLSFNLLCGYVFRPFAFLIGVPWKDCHIIAELLGKRLFINEFVAYQAMGEYMKAGSLQERSIMLGTYALCGFSNMGTIGVLLGGLSPLIPHRSQEIAEMAFRSILGGTITCLITACVAGFVVQAA
eukprot:CAMPEP_0117652498 /NCGR_PEP_ID=MMETSP0804-20121206/2661_1 /TAXON_ID=1074897 /ORGANISM="Tetraselmis astigmatica, Strain CCMP880" /LENGTH=604 /DNA_ID=CAMNT_0005458553 /DNA_START=299 /DNA_END=2114 /DNA_ORIENTATION=-